MVVEEPYEKYMTQNGTRLKIKWTAPKAALSGSCEMGYLTNNTETLNQLGSGYQMLRPANCMECVYEIRLQTWEATSKRRQSFEYLRTYFEEYFVSPEPPEFNYSSTRLIRRDDKWPLWILGTILVTYP
ncbi:unnamed protein product [Hymenolepis diminuta]|uniref:Pkinase_Tyr domain-containing protein n=1 Tax=Hymenolepis diminuta TaxID=6216 RepID=A0A0R3SX53_HYMDI|nr:unnamed protein product [Hymenolepis diminuta]